MKNTVARVRTLLYTSHTPLIVMHAHDKGCCRSPHYLLYTNRINYQVFHKLFENTIFVFTAWKQKKSSDKMLPPVGIEPGPVIASDSKSNTIFSTLTWHLLVRLCVCEKPVGLEPEQPMEDSSHFTKRSSYTTKLSSSFQETWILSPLAF